MKKVIYLTKEKKAELEKDLKELTDTKRKELADKLDWYRNNVEDEEDSTYSEILEQKDLLEQKIAEIEDMLSRAEIISQPKTSTVSIGNHVKVQLGHTQKEFFVVSHIEADPSNGKISNESPLGERLLGKRVNDEVEVDTPSGKMVYKILHIS